MKLIHPDIEKNLVQENSCVNFLIVENKMLFSTLIADLVAQLDLQDGKLLLSNYGEEVKISKAVDLLWSPYSLDMNHNRIVNNVHKTLSQSFSQHGDDMELNFAIHQLRNLLKDLLLGENTNFDLTEPSLVDIFKLFKVKFDEHNVSLLEKLQNYIISRTVYDDRKLFILHQFCSYFDCEDVREIAKFAKLEEVDVLLIEGSEHDFQRLKGANYVVIDKDLCVI